MLIGEVSFDRVMHQVEGNGADSEVLELCHLLDPPRKITLTGMATEKVKDVVGGLV